jgi:two-component system cell cycle response regulator
VPLTVSIGVAVGGPGISSERLIGSADEALYRAKRDGRNRAYLADPALDKSAV